MKTYVHLWQYLAEFFLEGKMFEIILQRKSRQQFMINSFFPENLDVYDIMWKNMVEPGRP